MHSCSSHGGGGVSVMSGRCAVPVLSIQVGINQSPFRLRIHHRRVGYLLGYPLAPRPLVCPSRQRQRRRHIVPALVIRPAFHQPHTAGIIALDPCHGQRRPDQRCRLCRHRQRARPLPVCAAPGYPRMLPTTALPAGLLEYDAARSNPANR